MEFYETAIKSVITPTRRVKMFDNLFHRHVYGLLKEVDTCQVHEVWHVCNCGKVVHQVIRDEDQHTWLPFVYSEGVSTKTYRDIELSHERCKLKTRTCSKCGLEELTKA
jgi:hypothetical protein